MKGVPSQGRISDVSDALNPPTAERFFWMRLVRYRQRRKLLCYEFSRSTNSSEWAGTKRFRLMCECSRRQIRIYAPPWVMARSVRICFTGLMFSRFKCRHFVIAFDDIPLLVEYLVDRYAKKAGKRIQVVGLFQTGPLPEFEV